MSRKLLTTEQAISLQAQIKSTWGWEGYYFFPLHPVARNDVLAFDSNLLESIFPESEFQKFVEDQSSSNIKCWREVGESEELQSKFFEFGYGYSETVIVSEGLDWLIYWSHENTVTLGGKEFIAKFKAILPNWSSALSKLN